MANHQLRKRSKQGSILTFDPEGKLDREQSFSRWNKNRDTEDVHRLIDAYTFVSLLLYNAASEKLRILRVVDTFQKQSIYCTYYAAMGKSFHLDIMLYHRDKRISIKVGIPSINVSFTRIFNGDKRLMKTIEFCNRIDRFYTNMFKIDYRSEGIVNEQYGGYRQYGRR